MKERIWKSLPGARLKALISRKRYLLGWAVTTVSPSFGVAPELAGGGIGLSMLWHRHDRHEEQQMIPHTFTASDGLKLAYYVDDNTDPWADAPTLLMLHAAMGNAQRFYAWVPMLSRHYRVVRLDLRGHGNSATPAPDSALRHGPAGQGHARADGSLWLQAAPTSSATRPGGYIGQNLAMGHPGRVKSLILFGSTPGLRNSQAATWIPRIARDGIRKFLMDTIEDRFVPGTDPRKIELVRLVRDDVRSCLMSAASSA